MFSPRLIRRLAVGALPTAVALLPAAASGAPVPPKTHGPLASTLALLAKPAVAAKSPAQQARVLGTPANGPGSLLRRGKRVVVRVRFEHGAVASRSAVRAAGGQVLDASRRYQTSTVAVTPADLKALAAIPTVAAVSPVRAPMLFATCEGGSVISEGVAQLHANTVHAGGVLGLGATVGVLSDSYNQATEAATGGPIATKALEDEETADLPGLENPCPGGQQTPLAVLQDFESEEATDEGRGMLQIVHDMAPESTLSFATAFESEAGFASNIEALATAGAETIVDDVGYFEEPFFQDGPIANAISKVTSLQGVTYLSAAGNDNLFDGEGNEIASWEAPGYRDSGACPAEVAALAAEGFNTSHCLDFNPGSATDRTFGIKVEAGELLTVDLQWAEPWEGVETDLDAFLLNANGELIGGRAEPALEEQRPLEIVQWANETGTTKTVQLVINRYTGPGARLKFVLPLNGGGVSGVEYPKSGGGDVVGPSVMGHAGSPSAIAVAAVSCEGCRAGADGSEPEFYSSRGPAVHFFEPVKGAGEPAEPIPGGEGEVISKPDIAATDCGGTTFFAVFVSSEWHFCGTSAAAPHAAGAVALMRSANPLASPERLRESLLGTGAEVGAFGPCAVGGGLVETVNAVKAAKEEIEPGEPGECELPDASGAVFVAPGNWGLENPPPSEPPPTTPTPPTPPQVSPPDTAFAKHPKKKVRIRGRSVKLTFRFRSNQSGVTFLCKVDNGAFRSCGAKLVHRFKPGKHVVRVKARNAAGLVDSSPAVFRFRVERVS